MYNIYIDTNFFQQNICVFYYFWDSRKQTPKKGRDQQWFEQGSSHGRSQRYVALCHWLGPKLVTTYKQLATWWLGHGGCTISISPGIVALKCQGLMDSQPPRSSGSRTETKRWDIWASTGWYMMFRTEKRDIFFKGKYYGPFIDELWWFTIFTY